MLQAQKQEQEIIDREKKRKERPDETLVKNGFPFLAKSYLISCSFSFINFLKFLDFPFIVSSAISLSCPLNEFLKPSLASFSASIKVCKCAINKFIAPSLI
jgi:hypothetical protein